MLMELAGSVTAELTKDSVILVLPKEAHKSLSTTWIFQGAVGKLLLVTAKFKSMRARNTACNKL